MPVWNVALRIILLLAELIKSSLTDCLPILMYKKYIKNGSVKKKYLTLSFFYCILPKVIAMEKIVEQSLLYDFYGELLTEHQKKIYEDAIFGDLSLGEIAEEYGISRQGVHDLIKRCNHTLQGYEDKLHLIQRFASVKIKVEEMNALAENDKLSREELTELIKQVAGQILEEL